MKLQRWLNTAFGQPVRLATSEDEAAAIAEEIGYPVVLKISSPKITHKLMWSGAEVGRRTAPLSSALTEILWSGSSMFDAPIYGVEAQKMVGEGVKRSSG